MQMTPLRDEFKIRVNLLGSHDPVRFTGAMNHSIGFAPGVGIAIDVKKIREPERSPARTRAINAGFRKLIGLLCACGKSEKCERAQEKTYRRKKDGPLGRWPSEVWGAGFSRQRAQREKLCQNLSAPGIARP